MAFTDRTRKLKHVSWRQTPSPLPPPWPAADEPHARAFHDACDSMARYSLSHTQLAWRDGQGGLVDDYREAYWWLRDKTPEDARVMAWWDYGYQITGIANRTSVADGNTWNHE